ncbi:hypothetical protein ABZY58_18360 [Micromonospora tulbaghiae]|uniref:hypothetical protein n=1 Tax=Micromonospora tulbaghiae TaxID=479978 RepID=UPI0033B86A27
MSDNPLSDANAQRLYFSPTDGGIEHSMSEPDFLRSLVYNLLFEPTALVVPDVFFFNCRFLIAHVESAKGTSLFEQALAKGRVVPAFRDENLSSFAEILELIGAQQVRGIEEEQYRSQPAKFADRLDFAFRRSTSGYIPWPPNLGGAFADLINAVLTQPELTTDHPKHQMYWRAMTDLRETIGPVAARETARHGGLGIRRAELFNAIGWHLGVLDRDRIFNKPRDLIRAVDLAGDSYRSEQVSFLVDVINVAYQRSQARKFDSTHNIPGALAVNAAPVVPSLAALAPDPETLRSITIDIRLPAVRSLLAASPNELLAIRDGSEGLGFFQARRAWVNDPSDDNAEDLREAAVTYAARLRELAKGPQKANRFTLAVRIGRKSLTGMLGPAVGYTAAVHHLPPEFTLVAAVGTTAAVAAFDVLAEGPHVPTQTYGLEVRSVGRKRELNLPSSGD